MSEYTPTTAEIEDWYAYDEWDTGPEEGTPRREEFRRWHAAEVRRAKAEALRYMGMQFEIASEQGTGVRDMIAAQFCYDSATELEQEDDND